MPRRFKTSKCIRKRSRQYSSKAALGSWQWRLAIGDWRLAVRTWQLALSPKGATTVAQHVSAGNTVPSAPGIRSSVTF